VFQGPFGCPAFSEACGGTSAGAFYATGFDQTVELVHGVFLERPVIRIIYEGHQNACQSVAQGARPQDGHACPDQQRSQRGPSVMVEFGRAESYAFGLHAHSLHEDPNEAEGQDDSDAAEHLAIHPVGKGVNAAYGFGIVQP